MNFEFSEAQTQLRSVISRLLRDRATSHAARQVIDRAEPFDRDLWQELARLGFLGVALPEIYGGADAGYLELCVVAEELGRSLAAVPFASTVSFGAELIRSIGTEAQRQAVLPRVTAGELIVSVAVVEGPGNPSPTTIAMTVSAGGTLHGTVWPVLDGAVAGWIIIPARDAMDRLSLFLVDTAGPGITCEALESLDPTRGQARITLHGARGEPLGAPGQGWAHLEAALDRAAIVTAFEQIGGAAAALEMARGYALEREAFGRKIGSFQTIKHKLVDMWVAVELARSNALFGAWSLTAEAASLPRAAAAARVSATQAHQLCTKENIQIHGGMGFTWESDCHLHHRRAQLLAVSLGGLSYWQDKLVHQLRQERAT